MPSKKRICRSLSMMGMVGLLLGLGPIARSQEELARDKPSEDETADPAEELPVEEAPPTELRAEDQARMILVPGGEFLMGDDRGTEAERPLHEVMVEAFYIDEHEVTNAQYEKFLDWVRDQGDDEVRHPDQPPGKDHTPRYWKRFRPELLEKTGMAPLQRFDETTFRKPEHPVVGVDWFDAYAYARWAKKRLPTEAEWEKAARGTDGRVWPWGDAWDFSKCNSGGFEWKGERDGHLYTAPAVSFPAGASPYGCLNMAGNVWEWVDSPYTRDHFSAGGDAPARDKVIKGGGSNSYPSSVRPAARRGFEPGYRSFNLGFRCAVDASTEAKAPQEPVVPAEPETEGALP